MRNFLMDRFFTLMVVIGVTTLCFSTRPVLSEECDSDSDCKNSLQGTKCKRVRCGNVDITQKIGKATFLPLGNAFLCSSIKDCVKGPCESAKDCDHPFYTQDGGSNFTCVKGECLPFTCLNDSECQQNSVCLINNQGVGHCQNPVQCNGTNPCAPGFTCVKLNGDNNNVCRPTCFQERCEGRLKCSAAGNEAVCVDEACSTDSDCLIGQLCRNSVDFRRKTKECQTTCNNTGCPEDSVCVELNGGTHVCRQACVVEERPAFDQSYEMEVGEENIGSSLTECPSVFISCARIGTSSLGACIVNNNCIDEKDCAVGYKCQFGSCEKPGK